MLIVLFTIGLVLIGIEFLVPGFGVFGISGITLLLFSSISLLSTPYGIFFLVAAFVITVAVFAAVIVMAVKVFKKSVPKSLQNTLFLDKSLRTEDGFVSSTENTSHLGEIMTVDSFLRPSGKIVKDGVVYDAISENKFIEKGKSVVVIGNKGYILVVKEV